MLRSRLPQIAAAMQPKTQLVIAQTAKQIALDAKAGVPVDTGDLRDSIQASAVGPAHWKVEAASDHAAFVEFGTRKMGARPYLVPAARRAAVTLNARAKGIV